MQRTFTNPLSNSCIKFQVSNCEAYYEAMHVESIWEVSPLDAVIETLSDVLFRPIAKFGHVLSDFFNVIIDRTPFIWTPVVLLLGFFLIALIIFGLLGYRFRSIFFSIEPSRSRTPDGQNSRYLNDANAIGPSTTAIPGVGQPGHLNAKQPHGRIQHSPKPHRLPYPAGPNLLDQLVPQSVSHHGRPEYRKN